MTRSMPALIAVILAAAPVSAGLVKNPDFSGTVPDGSPVGWTVPAKAGFVAVNDDGRSGHDSLRHKSAAECPRATVTQEVECGANTDYVLTAAFKTDGVLHPCVVVLSPEGGVLAQATATDDKQWALHTVAFNTREATKLRIEIDADAPARNTGKVSAGICWVDDVDIMTPADARKAGAKVPGYTGPPPGDNIALHRPYTLDPPPNYSYCTSPDDVVKLTDGVHTVGYFWTQKTTVGWNGSPATVTIDLGSDQPIRGASYSTAAGVAGVGWPTSIQVFVSDDGQTFYGAGDLITHAAKFGLPEPQGYSLFTFVADDLNTHGRYIRFIVSSSGYIFCDEIEVYKGPDTLLNANRGAAIADMKAYLRQQRVVSGVSNRLQRDLGAVEDLAAATKLDAATRARVNAELAAIRVAMTRPLPDFPANYRAVHPLVPLHARIYALNGLLQLARGHQRVAVWQKCRWDMLGPAEQPPERSSPAVALNVSMMDNEYRAEAFNITNLGPRDADVHVVISGLPKGDNPDYVTVHQVEFMENQTGIALADPLPVARQGNGGAVVSVPAGMTRQVWLTFHPVDVKPGVHSGQVRLKGLGAGDIALPLTLHVSQARMPDQPTMSLGMWDYTDGNGAYGIVPTNIQPSIVDMRAHFVDTPWANGGTAPWVGADAFDAANKLVKPPNFAAFDAWVSRWKGVRNYAVFLSVGDSFAGANMGDANFQPRVGAWLQAWAAHLKKLDITPQQVPLLIWDEPSTEDKDLLILTWARAVHASGTGFVVWEDPTHAAPEKGTVPEMFQECDVLCPNLGIYSSNAQASRDFYEGLRQKGKKLWFYQCSGPARTFDPIYYHRYHFWYAWNAGAVGSGFWAYGDTSGATNSWDEFLAGGTIFAPEYLDETSTTTSKHWEAVREGVEDYEYFVMLRDRVTELEKAGNASPLLAQAKELYTTGVRKVVGNYDIGKLDWTNERDRTAPDKLRVQILDMLDKLAVVR